MNNKEFQEKTWKMARGSMDATQYKQVLLGLLFLKYISIKFEEKYQELLAEEKGLENNPSSYTDNGIFYIPEEVRWNHIVIKVFDTREVFIIENAIRVLEEENAELRGIIPKVYNSEANHANTLSYLHLFSEIANLENDTKILGNLFNYCLTKLAEMEGKKAGDFYTPECITKTIVELLQPTTGNIYDPCCGTAGFLVESANLTDIKVNKNMQSFYGQEINFTTWQIAKMNLIINQLEADLGNQPRDTILDDLHPSLKADYIMANPPFKHNWPQKELKDDKRWKYGVPPRGNADYVWIQHMLDHLSENGKMAIVLANGALVRGGSEGKIREAILKDNLVEAIISLPTQLFHSTAIPANIWIINKNKQQEEILFIEARELGTMESRHHRVLTSADINMLKDTYNKFLEGTLEDEKGFCKVATVEDIEKQEYLLTPGRYVGFKPGEEYKTRKLGEIYKDSLEKQSQIVELNMKIEELLKNI